jgi:prepilin-type N-terminal cleavage/methylation domain-containing protein
MEVWVVRKVGFTLLEIMIVVALVGMLLSIAVPYYVRSRRTSQINICISNLSVIDGAKDRWAIENSKVNGDPVVWTDLVPYFVKHIVPCPAGGTYLVNPIGQNPECSIGPPHTL